MKPPRPQTPTTTRIELPARVRLLDLVAKEGLLGMDGRGLVIRHPEQVKGVPLFIVDEATEYFFKNDVSPEDILVSRPPFDQMWYESVASARIDEALFGKFHTPTVNSRAVKLVMFGGFITTHQADPSDPATPKDAAWLSAGTLVARFRDLVDKDLFNVAIGTMAYWSREDGGPCLSPVEGMEKPLLRVSYDPVTYPDDAPEGLHNLGSFGMYLLSPSLIAMTFMACVNVETPDASYPKGFRKAWVKRDRAPLNEYKVLTLDPSRPTGHASQGGEAVGSESGHGKRLHVVRGHFRHMPEVSKTGRHYRKRLFWVRPHTRGQASLGEVTKSYKVLPPE